MKYPFIFLLMTLIASASSNAEDANPYAVNNVDFVADYFPAKSKDKYGVIILTGSAGGKAESMTKRIVEMGYPVLSLSYFKDGPLPEALEMIPLEYFEAPKKWLMEQEGTKDDGVILLGLSKGAELALVLASEDPDYKAVIALGSSSVIWAGIPKDTSTITSASSSWSKQGKPLDFVPYIERDGLKAAGLGGMLFWHTAALANAQAVNKALIKVENITSPMLLISGGDDGSWPSTAMSAALCERANSKVQNCTHINYENGDHLLDNEIAAVNKEIFEFLYSIPTAHK